ncbi:MAG: SPFH domain-containing protein [Gordonia sp. (in: high G+C Gram-positive bacteria)]|uniref:flotillin family protein n=1 Tax=Gordonia sp. (in: high G+C Gram-positive bacteria) TaxID=84139 RepID=UPI0039E4B3DC
MSSSLVIVIALVVVVIVAAVLGLVSRYRVPGAEEAFIVTGTGKGARGKVYKGTGTFVLPVVQKATRVSLSSVKADLRTQTPAQDGIKLNIQAMALVKVGDEPEDILRAGPRFTDDLDKIEDQAIDQLSGELRSIVGTMTAKEVLTNREKLTAQVRGQVAENLRVQGLVLDAFNILEVEDADGKYFADLAAPERAEQAKIAANARSVAKADSDRVAAEQDRIAKQAQIANDQAVIEQQRQLDVERQEARKITERAAAEADAAKPLAEAERRLIQTEKDNEVAARQAELRQTQLDAEVIRPAQAERQAAAERAEAAKVEQIARAEAEARTVQLRGEADKAARIAASQAEAESIRVRGTADAETIKLRGAAEAESIRVKGAAEAQAIEERAEALAKLDEVGQLELVVNGLPAIVGAAAEPLSGASITLVGKDTSAVTESVVGGVSQLLPALKEATGIDLGGVLTGMTGNLDSMANGDGTKGEAEKR